MENPKVKFVRIRDVKLPERGTPSSAGVDIFVPNDFVETTMHANTDILIDSGIKVLIPKGYALKAVDKSGVCAKKKLKLGAKLIDEDYAGEIKIHLFNLSGKKLAIKPGMKLVQLLLVRAYYEEWIETTEHDHIDFHKESVRGAGGFGHTDSK